MSFLFGALVLFLLLYAAAQVCSETLSALRTTSKALLACQEVDGDAGRCVRALGWCRLLDLLGFEALYAGDVSRDTIAEHDDDGTRDVATRRAPGQRGSRHEYNEHDEPPANDATNRVTLKPPKEEPTEESRLALAAKLESGEIDISEFLSS